MSNSDAAEYRRRTDEAIRRLSGETDPAALDHWRKLAIEYSRLSDLTAMREGLQRKRAVKPRSKAVGRARGMATIGIATAPSFRRVHCSCIRMSLGRRWAGTSGGQGFGRILRCRSIQDKSLGCLFRH